MLADVPRLDAVPLPKNLLGTLKNGLIPTGMIVRLHDLAQ
jgi:hypothetical protein